MCFVPVFGLRAAEHHRIRADTTERQTRRQLVVDNEDGHPLQPGKSLSGVLIKLINYLMNR